MQKVVTVLLRVGRGQGGLCVVANKLFEAYYELTG